MQSLTVPTRTDSHTERPPRGDAVADVVANLCAVGDELREAWPNPGSLAALIDEARALVALVDSSPGFDLVEVVDRLWMVTL